MSHFAESHHQKETRVNPNKCLSTLCNSCTTHEIGESCCHFFYVPQGILLRILYFSSGFLLFFGVCFSFSVSIFSTGIQLVGAEHATCSSARGRWTLLMLWVCKRGGVQDKTGALYVWGDTGTWGHTQRGFGDNIERRIETIGSCWMIEGMSASRLAG